MDNYVVRLDTPVGIASAVPALIGFTPAPGDVAVISMSGKRLGMTARVSMPHVHVPTVQAVIRSLRNGSDVERVILVAYSVASGYAADLADVFELQGMPVLETLRVTPAGDVWCECGACDAPKGNVNGTVSPVEVAATIQGKVLYGSRDEMVERVQWSGVKDHPQWELLAFWRKRLFTDDARDETLGMLAELDADMLGTTLDELCLLARHTPPWGPGRNVVLSVAAFAAYLYGDGALANACLDGVTGDYTLATLLRASLDAALPPAVLREVVLAAND